MILQDQPSCFPENVTVIVSCRGDGSVLRRVAGVHNPDFVARRVAICKFANVQYADTVFQRIIYDTARTYSLISEVDNGSTTKFTEEVVADALYTTAKGVALLLPVGDCAATVVYDTARGALALAHLGRHSTYAKLATRLVRHFLNDGSKPGDLTVWMSPHAQKVSYKLDWFDQAADPDWRGYYEQKADGIYLDIAGFNRHLMEQLGVLSQNIHISAVDTMQNPNYFSHAAGDTSGRVAVVAVMR